MLFYNFGDDARPDGLATFADSEAVLIVHSHWGEQFNLEGYLVTRHDDFLVGWKFDFTSHIGGAEVELWLVTLREWSVAAAFLFLQDVNLCFKLSVWSDSTRLCDHLTTFDLVTLNTTEKQTCVIASLTLVKSLVEGFDTSHHRLLSVAKTNDFNFIVELNDTLLDTTGSNSTTAFDREDILDRHQEWLIKVVLWDVKVFIHRSDELHDSIFTFLITFKSLSSRTLDDRSVVAIKAIFVQKITDIHLHELNEFWISKVHLIQENDDLWYVHLVSEKYVLTSLWQRTIVGSHHEDSTINLCSTGNHVLNVVCVAWHIDVCVVALLRLILLVRSSDGDTTRLFLWSVIDLIIGNRLVDIRRKSLCKYVSNCSS